MTDSIETPTAIARRFAEMVFLHLKTGSAENAHESINAWEKHVEEMSRPVEIDRNSPLSDLAGIPVKTLNILEQSGYLYVGDILDANRKTLIQVRHFGPRQFDEIKNALERHGYSLD